MDKQEKKYLEDALRAKRSHERFNKALARTISDKEKGKDGYVRYINMMSEVRKLAYKKRISNEEAVKRILGRT